MQAGVFNCVAENVMTELEGVAIAIPCHRVVGKSGGLVGYNGGLQIKKRLLEREHFDLSILNR